MNTNSFGTSPSDRLTLGDRVTQVIADTGSTVPTVHCTVTEAILESSFMALAYTVFN